MIRGRVSAWTGDELRGRRRERLERLEACFATHYDALLRFAFFVAGSRPEAEDLVHDAFVRMWGVADSLQEEGMLAYARRTIVNLHRSSLRRLARRRQGTTSGAVMETDPSARQDVRRALLTLTAGQRACLALRYYEDLPLRVIAETLNLTEDAVKKHIQRGSERLRVLLAEEVVG